MLPTVSNRPRITRDDIEDYFQHFLTKRPQGTIRTRTVRIGCNWAVDAGTYDFSVLNDNNQRVTVPARYTYVYVFDESNQWRIAHHHSSAMPEKLTDQPASKQISPRN